jgi:deoxycytidine triphosphate deaminase
MFIKPTTAIANGWIQGITNQEKQVQPNAIDFTLDTLKVLSADSAIVSEDHKKMRELYDVPSTAMGWILEYRRVYDGTSSMYVDLPEGVAAILYTRSTLARNGVFLVSGLYDSGYKGHIGFTIYPICGNITIHPGTRVGQIAFVAAESAKLYAGGWNHEQGTHYTL